nr:sterile alpha motif domain-containing protein 1-like [Symphalangus syndactylus]
MHTDSLGPREEGGSGLYFLPTPSYTTRLARVGENLGPASGTHSALQRPTLGSGCPPRSAAIPRLGPRGGAEGREGGSAGGRCFSGLEAAPGRHRPPLPAVPPSRTPALLGRASCVPNPVPERAVRPLHHRVPSAENPPNPSPEIAAPPEEAARVGRGGREAPSPGPPSRDGAGPAASRVSLSRRALRPPLPAERCGFPSGLGKGAEVRLSAERFPPGVDHQEDSAPRTLCGRAPPVLSARRASNPWLRQKRFQRVEQPVGCPAQRSEVPVTVHGTAGPSQRQGRSGCWEPGRCRSGVGGDEVGGAGTRTGGGLAVNPSDFLGWKRPECEEL